MYILIAAIMFACIIKVLCEIADGLKQLNGTQKEIKQTLHDILHDQLDH